MMTIALAYDPIAADGLNTSAERTRFVTDTGGVSNEQVSAVSRNDLCFKFQAERSDRRCRQGRECSLC